MPSPGDLDQGGFYRAMDKVYFGPTIGFVLVSTKSRFGITAPGSYTIDPSFTVVAINNPTGGVVTITLPSLAPAPTQQVLPGCPNTVNPVITVIDIFGNANTGTYTIQPAAGDTLDNNLASVQLLANFGQFNFTSSAGARKWTTS